MWNEAPFIVCNVRLAIVSEIWHALNSLPRLWNQCNTKCGEKVVHRIDVLLAVQGRGKPMQGGKAEVPDLRRIWLPILIFTGRLSTITRQDVLSETKEVRALFAGSKSCRELLHNAVDRLWPRLTIQRYGLRSAELLPFSGADLWCGVAV